MAVLLDSTFRNLACSSHLCQFYRHPRDLLDVQVAFFAEGINRDEGCVWVVAPPLDVDQARAALGQVVPDISERIRTKRIEFIDGNDLYGGRGELDRAGGVAVWPEREAAARRRGLAGLRISGNISGPLSASAWNLLMDYERKTDAIIHGRPIKALCCYAVSSLSPDRIADVAGAHQQSLVRRGDAWEVIENRDYLAAELQRSRVDALLRAAAANLPVGLVVYSAQQRIQLMNSTALAWSRSGLEQVFGLTDSQVYGDRMAAEYLEALNRACETLSPQTVECAWVQAESGPADRVFKCTCTPVLSETGCLERVVALVEDITDRKRAEAQAQQLRSIEWMLTKRAQVAEQTSTYADLATLNTTRLIRDSVGEPILREITDEAMGLLDTSIAVYERNGDYALDINSSSWCRFLDRASYQACGTQDVREALAGGRWLCHESCWTDAGRVAIENGWPADVECRGGLRLHAVPIRAQEEVVGAICQGYGSPPKEIAQIETIAQRYGVDPLEACRHARAYEERPAYIVELAKRRLLSAARLIGEIVERRRTEDALRQSEERFRLLYERAPQGYQSLDAEGRLLDVNEAWLEALGYRRDEVIGRWFGEFLAPHQVPAFRERFPRFKELGKTTVEFEMRHKDGSLRTMFIVGRIGYDPRGRFKQTHCILNDVTERKRLEEERLQLQQQLLHAQKLESLGVLAGGIAHDFNNLLQAIMGHLELAEQDLAGDSRAREHVGQSIRAARQAVNLTRQMLAYSGRGSLKVTALHLNDIVEESVEILRAACSKKVSIELDLASELPAISADSGQIQQVVMNLITNAAEAVGGEAGVVRVSTGAQECDRAVFARNCIGTEPAPGPFVRLEVSDTGCGMDAATRQRMFDPFFSTKFAGRGLGMAVVLGILRGHHGALVLDSEPGKGTTVRAYFPACSEAIPPRQGAELAVASPSNAQGTVLVVEDEEMIRTLCQASLTRAGYRTLLAADGQQGLDLLREHPDAIDVVLLDLTMPRMDGITAFHEMRRIKPGLRVILCSGFSQRDATRSFGGEDLAGFLQKPYNLTALRSELARVLAEPSSVDR